MAQNAKANPPPTLLTIPRELRQKILYYTFCDSLNADTRLKMTLALLFCTSLKRENDNLTNFALKNVDANATTSYTYDWVHTLNRVHPVISSELRFVIKQVLDELDFEVISDPVGGWRRRMIRKELLPKEGRWEWLCSTPWTVRQLFLMEAGTRMMMREIFESGWDPEMSEPDWDQEM